MFASMFNTNEDGSWTDSESGQVYQNLPDLFSEITSRWKTCKYAIDDYTQNIGIVDKVVLEMRAAEFPKYDEIKKELTELIELEKQLQEIMRTLIVQLPHDKQPGTTIQTRKDAEISELDAVQYLIEQGDRFPSTWLSLSAEGKKILKLAVTDRDSKYYGVFPDYVVKYVEKKSAVIKTDEILNGSKKKGVE